MSNLYQKIEAPYLRDTKTNRLIPGEWRSDVIGALARVPIWQITEKIDGTNIRVIWDGYRVSFGGRTERAQLPPFLTPVLEQMFPEEKFEESFGDKPVILFGEGYGPRIQKVGGQYREDVSFALFDVKVNDNYLRPGDTESLAESWGIEHVPVLSKGGWTLTEGIQVVRDGLLSRYGTFPAEGLVAKTYPGLLDHRGNRLVVKIKGVDFQ